MLHGYTFLPQLSEEAVTASARGKLAGVPSCLDHGARLSPWGRAAVVKAILEAPFRSHTLSFWFFSCHRSYCWFIPMLHKWDNKQDLITRITVMPAVTAWNSVRMGHLMVAAEGSGIYNPGRSLPAAVGEQQCSAAAPTRPISGLRLENSVCKNQYQAKADTKLPLQPLDQTCCTFRKRCKEMFTAQPELGAFLATAFSM